MVLILICSSSEHMVLYNFLKFSILLSMKLLQNWKSCVCVNEWGDANFLAKSLTYAKGSMHIRTKLLLNIGFTECLLRGRFVLSPLNDWHTISFTIPCRYYPHPPHLDLRLRKHKLLAHRQVLRYRMSLNSDTLFPISTHITIMKQPQQNNSYDIELNRWMHVCVSECKDECMMDQFTRQQIPAAFPWSQKEEGNVGKKTKDSHVPNKPHLKSEHL